MKAILSKSLIPAVLVIAALAAGTGLLAGYIDRPTQAPQAAVEANCDGCPLHEHRCVPQDGRCLRRSSSPRSPMRRLPHMARHGGNRHPMHRHGRSHNSLHRHRRVPNALLPEGRRSPGRRLHHGEAPDHRLPVHERIQPARKSLWHKRLHAREVALAPARPTTAIESPTR